MKKFFKRFTLPIIMLLILGFVLLNLDEISDKISSYLKKSQDLVILPSNEYTKDYDFMFIKESKDYIPYSFNDLLDIFYSTINNGWEIFTFYCPTEYVDCISDVKKISDDNELLTHLNNYTHPYNNFDNLRTIFDESGEVTIKITHLYDDTMIKELNAKVDSIINEVITSDMDDETKIITIHDYIINHAKYDIDKNENGLSDYKSNLAYGPLIQGYAICGGYADSMALFLTKLGFKNYKIASISHVWNAVYVNDKWLHLDLTWDDPVSEQGKDYLYHKYFLVNSAELAAADGDLQNHVFNSSIYLEFK